MKRAMFTVDGQPIFGPEQVAALRMTLAGLFLVPFGWNKLKALWGKDGPYLIISGVLGSTIPAFLFTAAQQEIASALAGMLNALTPLFTFGIGLLFFRMPFERRRLIGVLIGLLGAISLLYFKQESPFQMNVYALLIVCATVCYGTNINILKRFLSHRPSLMVSALSLMVVAPFTAVIAWRLDTASVLLGHEQGWEALGYVAILAAISTSLGLILFNRLIQLESALFASSVTYFIPIAAIGWGVWDGERISVMQYVGIALILFGVWVVNRKKRTKNISPTD